MECQEAISVTHMLVLILLLFKYEGTYLKVLTTTKSIDCTSVWTQTAGTQHGHDAQVYLHIGWQPFNSSKGSAFDCCVWLNSMTTNNGLVKLLKRKSNEGNKVVDIYIEEETLNWPQGPSYHDQQLQRHYKVSNVVHIFRWSAISRISASQPMANSPVHFVSEWQKTASTQYSVLVSVKKKKKTQKASFGTSLNQ